MKYTVQTSKGPVRFHSVGEPIVGIPAEGAAMTDKANGYLPESGVWTAREREFWINRTESETVKTAAKTVAALVAALEDALPMLVCLGDFIGNGEVNADRPGSLGARCDLIGDIKSLLDAVKK